MVQYVQVRVDHIVPAYFLILLPSFVLQETLYIRGHPEWGWARPCCVWTFPVRGATDKRDGTGQLELCHTHAQRALWPFPVFGCEHPLRQGNHRTVLAAIPGYVAYRSSVDALMVEAWLHVCSPGNFASPFGM
jgi:hypothetical protein